MPLARPLYTDSPKTERVHATTLYRKRRGQRYDVAKMPNPELRIVYPSRIFPTLNEGAVLRDPDDHAAPLLTIERIDDHGAHTYCGRYLTAPAIDALSMVSNGPAPKRAA